MNIAWIGTGVMGRPMLGHLAKEFGPIKAYNRSLEKAKDIEYVVVKENIQETVKDADFIFTILSYPEDVKSVCREIFKFAKKNAVIIDMTTSSPTLAKELASVGEKRQIIVCDAPVTGGDIGAVNGSLTLMFGGPKHVFNTVQDYFKTFAKDIYYVGTAGTGQYAKLANQISIAGALQGVAESIHFAIENDIDPTIVLNIISSGSASSWQAINNGPKMLADDMQAGFYLKHIHKDLGLALEHKHSDLPLLEQSFQVYDKLLNQHAEEGSQAIIKYYKNKKDH